jgi:alpha-1,6-mannosyltransferase
VRRLWTRSDIWLSWRNNLHRSFGRQAERLPYKRLKICDLTQFYSPVSGGVKRYLHEKSAYIDKYAPSDEQILVVPGPKTEVTSNGRARIYSIRSPLVSRTSRYRALLNLREVENIIERERPDILESSDPYQIGWKAIGVGRALNIPVVGFYHSHFTEAYLRSAAKLFGRAGGRRIMKLGRAYVRRLYNQMEATFVASEPLAKVLRNWGLRNVHVVGLGVNTDIFNPEPDDRASTRESLGVAPNRKLLLYVGRLAPEKNTLTLFRSFELLARRRSGEFHLLVIGDGPHRAQLRTLQRKSEAASSIRYCAQPAELARFYRAADLFVHAGVQETFGLAALESQACGTPVVGIAGSYMDKVILHEQEGWAGENTPEALAAAIETWSAKDLTTIGQAAARRAQHQHAWPRVFSQLFCIYREVCAKYRRS